MHEKICVMLRVIVGNQRGRNQFTMEEEKSSNRSLTCICLLSFLFFRRYTSFTCPLRRGRGGFPGAYEAARFLSNLPQKHMTIQARQHNHVPPELCVVAASCPRKQEKKAHPPSILSFPFASPVKLPSSTTPKPHSSNRTKSKPRGSTERTACPSLFQKK